MIFNKKKKQKKKKQNDVDLGAWPKPEKKKFLSMDLIERMVRVERGVSSSFGKKVPAKRTQYYKSLTKQERNDFEKHLKKKRRNKVTVAILFLMVFAVPFIINSGFTGNVIESNSDVPLSFFEAGALIFVVVFVTMFLIVFIIRKVGKERFEKHFDVLDKIAVKHYGNR